MMPSSTTIAGLVRITLALVAVVVAAVVAQSATGLDRLLVLLWGLGLAVAVFAAGWLTSPGSSDGDGGSGGGGETGGFGDLDCGGDGGD